MNIDATSIYRKSVGQSATPIRLVILLYEQLAEDLRRAAAAFDQRDVEARTNHLSHALEVVGELQGALDMQAGQDVARNLSDFYHTLRESLLQVQLHSNRRLLERQIANVLSVREAWVEVERSNTGAPPIPEAQQQPSRTENVAGTPRADWRA